MLKEKVALPIKKSVLSLVALSFIYDLALTFLSPLYPVFLSTFFSKPAYVGYLTASFALLMMFFGFLVAKILEHIKKITLLKIGLLGFSLTLIALPQVNNLPFLISIEILRAFFLTAIILPMSLLIRETASKNNLGKIEGLYFTVTNLAWMVGPLLGGILAKTYDINSIFYLSAIFPVISFFIISRTKFKEHNHVHKETKLNLFINFKDFAKHPDLLINCFLTSLLLMWWSVIYTFVPLYIKSVNLGVNITGYVLFLVVVPLILLEIPAGHFSDKLGFKKFFILGFFLMALFPILTIFTTSIKLTLILIILASIGAAFIEPLREAYFFQVVGRNDEIRFYPIYKMAVPMGQLTGPIILSTVLLATDFKFLFVFAGSLSVLGIIASMFLKR